MWIFMSLHCVNIGPPLLDTDLLVTPFQITLCFLWSLSPFVPPQGWASTQPCYQVFGLMGHSLYLHPKPEREKDRAKLCVQLVGTD